MSLSARRLTGQVRLGRFDWQPKLTSAAGFADDTAIRSIEAPAGTARFAETREITLPSAAAERARTIERDAYARGLADGEHNGEIAATARLAPVIERLQQTIDTIGSLRDGMLRRTERDLVKLAIAMADRIVRREIQQDRELLLAMARIAVERLGERVAATIHLHPDDVDAVTAGRTSPVQDSLTIAADSALPRGGCRIESAFGKIDAGVDAQIHELARSLLGDA